MILAMLILWVVVLILLTFESGERVTYHFDQFGVELNQCEWDNLPIKMQRMYLIFLLDTQQPKFIEISGDIACTRKTFKNVFINMNTNGRHFQYNVHLSMATFIFR